MIKLEYFTPEDFQLLIDWISDEDLMVNWAGSQFRFPLTKEKLQLYLEDTNDFKRSGTFIYKVVDGKTNEAVGHASLTAINRSNRSARITRVLVGDSRQRGRGMGEQIIKAMMKIGFEDLNLHRMSLGVYDFNEPAIKCYKKCGFQNDGVLRDVSRHGDTFWSLMEMSILENEYRTINAGLQPA